MEPDRVPRQSVEMSRSGARLLFIVREFIAFAGVGAIATASHYAVLVVAVQLAGVDALSASTVGVLVGAIVGYVLNYTVTFKSDAVHARAIPRYAVAVLIGAGVNYLTLSAILRHFDVHYLIAQVVATAIVLSWNFAVARVWVYRSRC